MHGHFHVTITALLAAAMLIVSSESVRAETISHGGTTVDMDFVIVGNPGNPADTTGSPNPCGAVGYSYDIAKYAVSEAQWDAVAAADAADLLEDAGYWGGDAPIVGVNWHQAAMFCNWLTSGNATAGAYAINAGGEVVGIDRAAAVVTYGEAYVLPTMDEWYKAAYYDGNANAYYDYPTGSDATPDGIDFFGDTNFDAVFWDGGNNPGPNDVTDAGVLSPYGTMGQGGNVWEWNETAVGQNRGARGGYWSADSTPLLSNTTADFAPDSSTLGVGFRVAVYVPEPGSAMLLLCGLVSLAFSVRRRR